MFGCHLHYYACISAKVYLTSPKGFSASNCDVRNSIFLNLRNLLRNFLEFFFGFFGVFCEEFFERNILGQVLGGEDFFV